MNRKGESVGMYYLYTFLVVIVLYAIVWNS